MNQQLPRGEQTTPPKRTVVVGFASLQSFWDVFVRDDVIGFPFWKESLQFRFGRGQRIKIYLSRRTKPAAFSGAYCHRIQHIVHTTGLSFGPDVITSNGHVGPRRDRLAAPVSRLGFRIKINTITFYYFIDWLIQLLSSR